MKWDELTADQKNELVAARVMERKLSICEARTEDIFVSLPSPLVPWRRVSLWCRKCGIQFDSRVHPDGGGPGNILWVHAPGEPRYTESMDAAWQVVERMTRIPRTLEEAERAANTRFGHWWEKAHLWACSQEEACEEICHRALYLRGVLDADDNVREEEQALGGEAMITAEAQPDLEDEQEDIEPELIIFVREIDFVMEMQWLRYALSEVA